jgi:alpha,alpha-trehalase
VSPGIAFKADVEDKPCGDAQIPDGAEDVRNYILSNWEDTVRHNNGKPGNLALPHHYTVPCRRKSFQEFYYWDTYFTCLGLVASDRKDLAVANLRNFVHLIETLGFVPNAARDVLLNRSQPPYLAALSVLLQDEIVELGLRGETRKALETEYLFWTTQRQTSLGLSRYSHRATAEELQEFLQENKDRAGLANLGPSEWECPTAHALAEAESGWDFTIRFDGRCGDFCPVDLNGNLYTYETLLASLSGGEERDLWRRKADTRRSLFSEYLWDEKAGAFVDYDLASGRKSPNISAASFHPLWVGLATPAEAQRVVDSVLPVLEYPYGMVPCVPPPGSRVTQWAAPNLWPCLQYVTYRGLERYGYRREALRVASKYLDVVTRCFNATGDLWEKYNAETGLNDTSNEAGYPLPAMMGWTAGVFMDALEFCETTETHGS